MDGRDIMEGLAVVKAVADTVRALSGVFSGQKPRSYLIPVYRPVIHETVARWPLPGPPIPPENRGGDK